MWEETAQALWESGVCYFVKHNNYGIEMNTYSGKYITIYFNFTQKEYTICIYKDDDIFTAIKSYTRLDIVDLEWNKWVA